MGNHNSHSGKVLLPDGSTHEFNDPITVAELMLEYPQRVVVEYQQPPTTPQGRTGRPRLTPLPADKKLDLGKLYLMLPYKPGKPVSLSSKEANQLLIRANNILKARAVLSTSKFLSPFLAKMCPSTTSLGISENIGHEVRKRQDGCDKEDMNDDVSEKKEYTHHQLNRQVSGRSGMWKPSLDTIKEKKDEKIVGRESESHWVIVASKVVKRIEKGGLVWA